MRTIRELFGGGDLLHLALVLSLLRVDINEIGHARNNFRNRMENDFRIRHRVNPISQKVIDDLSELGRYGPIRPDPLEITAYILNTETNLNTENLTEQPNQLIFDQIDELILPDPNVLTGEDLDSGVSDVGQMSDTETDGSRSPDNANFAADFDVLSPASSLGTAGADPISESPPIFPDNFDFDRLPYPSFDGLDWAEIESVAMQEGEAAAATAARPPAQPEREYFGGDSEHVFDWAEVEADAAMEDLDLDGHPPPLEYDPDEEEVENQLIEIENRLIDLDGSIEHINDGVRHLGEALATAQTDETVEALLEDIEDDEVERFLFDDAAADLSMAAAAIRSDPGFNLFDDWRMDVEPDLEEILSGIPEPDAPLVPSIEAIKKEAEEEVRESPDPEKMKPVTIKQEKVEVEEEESVESSVEVTFFDPAFVVKTEEDDTSSEYSSSGSFHSGNVHSHLANHSYAASSEFNFPSKSSNSFSYDFEYDGASAVASASPMSFCSDASRLRENRDERKARQLGIPFSLSDLIDSPMEEFNTMMTNSKLTEEQVALCRDIRRRGKNKVAAQNCRRRKLDLISSLEIEVSHARQQKQMLIAEREQLYRLRQEWSEKLRQLEEAVLRGLNKDAEQFALQLTPDGQSVRVAQRHSSRLTKPARA